MHSAALWKRECHSSLSVRFSLMASKCQESPRWAHLAIVAVSCSWITESLEMPATRSSGLMPDGPIEKGVGAGVAGIPVLPPELMPSSTFTVVLSSVSKFS